MITMMVSALEKDIEREFIEDIYKKYYSVMFKKAFSLLNNAEDSEELVQDVFTNLINRADSVMAVEPKKLPAYLISAVKFGAYGRFRKKLKYPMTDFEDFDIELLSSESAIPEDIIIKNETVAELYSALEKIPERYKNLLEFKYILGLSDSQIGSKLGITESAVRSGLTRARRKAYSVMKEEEKNAAKSF